MSFKSFGSIANRVVDDVYERQMRDAGRGHLLGDYRSPLERSDIERKRQNEEGKDKK